MKINPQVKKLWTEKDKSSRNWCKDCSDSGCDNPVTHEQMLMQFAYDLAKGGKK